MGADDYVGAVAEFEKALELAPFAVIRFNLGLAYAKLDEPAKAVAMLEKTLADPGNLSTRRIEQAKRLLAEQQRRLGQLELDVSEAGAVVRVDGVELGRTPLDKALRAATGTHFVEVVKPGYEPAHREVQVKAQSVTRVRIVLDATEKPMAQVWIRSRLIDAEVWLDGKRIGRTPLDQSIPVLAGRHAVEVKRRGYLTARKSVAVDQGATAEVELTPKIDDGALDDDGGTLVFSDEYAHELFLTVDGARRGLYRSPLPLPPGIHVVRVERAGFFATTLHVDIAPRQTKTQRVVLEPTVEKIAEHDREMALYLGFGIGTMVGGAALVGGGIGFTVWNNQRIDQRNAELEADPDCFASGGETLEKCIALATRVDDARAQRPVGYVLIGVGGALMVTGVVLLVLKPGADELQPDDDDAFDTARLLPLLEFSDSGVLLGVRGSF
jgi:hypothetical protein